jgi:ATP-dependent helicase/nuclease subunit A
LSAQTADALERRIAWQYPSGDATRQQAKTSVSELKRRPVEEDEEALPLFKSQVPSPEAQGRRRQADAAGRLSAVERGTAHHTFLEFMSLSHPVNGPFLREEAARMEGAGILSAQETAVLDFAALAKFWQSELGERIRAQADCVRREMQFTARMSANDLATVGLTASTGLGEEEFVIVQGVVDLAMILPDQIVLVDFKTDEMPAGRLAEKVEHYAPQLKLYGLALERICRRPVRARWLHFLSLGQTVAV